MADMTQKLKPFIQSYLELFQTSVVQATASLSFAHGPRLLVSDQQVLLGIVTNCEQAKEFARLVIATNEVFSSSKTYGNRGLDVTGEHVKNFFRLSSAYQDIYADPDAAIYDDLCSRYLDAFGSAERKVTWILPLGLVSFNEDTVPCGDFTIRCFTAPELNCLLKAPSKRIFYPDCYVDPARLIDYWFLCVEEVVAGSVGMHQFEGSGEFEPQVPFKSPMYQCTR